MKNIFNLGILSVITFTSLILYDCFMQDRFGASVIAPCFIGMLAIGILLFIKRAQAIAKKREEEAQRSFIEELRTMRENLAREARLERERRMRDTPPEETRRQVAKRQNPLMKKTKKKKEEQCTEELIF